MLKIKLLTFGCFLLLFLSEVWCWQPVCIFSAGDYFPEIVFEALLTQQEKGYLGISDSLKNSTKLDKLYSFTFLDIKAELLIVEFLNVHCVSCQAQAPVMNRVYELIQKDDYLRGKVKMLGICPGNTYREIMKFKKEKAVQFPFIPDTQFDYYEVVGGQCGTPFILMVRRGEKDHIITWSHIGQISSPLYFMQEAWDALKTDLHAVAQKAKEKGSMKIIMERPEPYISDEEMQKKILASMERLKLNLSGLKKVTLSNNEDIFIIKAIGRGGEKFLFSKLISRNSVCDLCHAIHFVLTFDEKGVVVNFDPIHVTKYGNVKWSIAEIIQTREKLIGKSILKPIAFDPEVDAVSLATMSSSLIFNSVQRAERYYKELQQKGYINQ
jgi:hypothetical protein